MLSKVYNLSLEFLEVVWRWRESNPRLKDIQYNLYHYSLWVSPVGSVQYIIDNTDTLWYRHFIPSIPMGSPHPYFSETVRSSLPENQLSGHKGRCKLYSQSWWVCSKSIDSSCKFVFCTFECGRLFSQKIHDHPEVAIAIVWESSIESSTSPS